MQYKLTSYFLSVTVFQNSYRCCEGEEAEYQQKAVRRGDPECAEEYAKT